MDGDEVLSVELASWMVVRGCGRGVRHSRARAGSRDVVWFWFRSVSLAVA